MLPPPFLKFRPKEVTVLGCGQCFPGYRRTSFLPRIKTTTDLPHIPEADAPQQAASDHAPISAVTLVKQWTKLYI